MTSTVAVTVSYTLSWRLAAHTVTVLRQAICHGQSTHAAPDDDIIILWKQICLSPNDSRITNRINSIAEGNMKQPSKNGNLHGKPGMVSQTVETKILKFRDPRRLIELWRGISHLNTDWFLISALGFMSDHIGGSQPIIGHYQPLLCPVSHHISFGRRYMGPCQGWNAGMSNASPCSPDILFMWSIFLAALASFFI
jgi:hypothetical protein